MKTAMVMVMVVVMGMVLVEGQESGSYLSPHLRSVYANSRILRSHVDHPGDGNYNYLWETSEGTQAEERGFLKSNSIDVNGPPILAKTGSYSYYSPEGQLIKVVYTADENGFQAYGDHLPTPPPIPPAIQKSLDLIYAGIEARKREEAAAAARGFRTKKSARY